MGLVAIVVAACANSPEVAVSGVDPPPVEPTATSEPTVEPPATATPTPMPPATPTATPEPTAVPGFGCEAEPLPADVTDVSEAEVNVDGDDDPDVATAYHADPDRSTGWAIRVAFGNGDIVETTVGFGFPESIGVQSVGGADVDGDGRDEVFAVVGSGASVVIYGMFEVEPDACTIEPIVGEGGPVEAAAGASVGALAGLRCDDTDGDGSNDTVALYSGFLVPDTDPLEYDIAETRYQLDGTDLRPVDSTNYRVSIDGPDFPRRLFDCPPLSL